MQNARKPFYRKIWFWILAAVATGLLVFGISYLSYNHQTSNDVQISAEDKQLIKDINNWYQDTYKKMPAKDLPEDPNDLEGTRQQKMQSIVDGFRLENDYIYVVSSYKEISEAGLTSDQVGEWGLNVVLANYDGQIPENKNFKNSFTRDPFLGNFGNYVYLNDND